MTSLRTAREDALRFITGFEMKHGRGPSVTEIADGQFDGDIAVAEGAVLTLIADRRVRRNFPTASSKLQALVPLPVPRSPFGEPLHFIRIGEAAA